ncbi:proline-rich protein 36-like isoform X9 [Schistocerca nitens]|uniref:proline-rich protein 36-like isoform X9 n=1 Tax=Schistocerca nitens TaxID=7011 RepID=UPI0021190051|nr:proline-rich protein 36-like isoform X9 [Schistocerca nitens]
MTAVNERREPAAADLGDLLDAGDAAFVTLEAGQTRLAAHAAVLAARSPVFAAMFQHDMLEAACGRVSIADVEAPVMRQLLAYMYTLQTPQLASTAPQLLAAADKYGLTALKAACERQMAAQLDVENAAAAAVVAVRHSCPQLTAAAVAFINANRQVLSTRGWAEAMRNHLEHVIEVTRLLSESPAETRRRLSSLCAGRRAAGTPRRLCDTAGGAAHPWLPWLPRYCLSTVARPTTPTPLACALHPLETRRRRPPLTRRANTAGLLPEQRRPWLLHPLPHLMRPTFVARPLHPLETRRRRPPLTRRANTAGLLPEQRRPWLLHPLPHLMRPSLVARRRQPLQTARRPPPLSHTANTIRHVSQLWRPRLLSPLLHTMTPSPLACALQPLETRRRRPPLSRRANTAGVLPQPRRPWLLHPLPHLMRPSLVARRRQPLQTARRPPPLRHTPNTIRHVSQLWRPRLLSPLLHTMTPSPLACARQPLETRRRRPPLIRRANTAGLLPQPRRPWLLPPIAHLMLPSLVLPPGRPLETAGRPPPPSPPPAAPPVPPSLPPAPSVCRTATAATPAQLLLQLRPPRLHAPLRLWMVMPSLAYGDFLVKRRAGG